MRRPAGRPEFEIYDGPRELAAATSFGFFDLAGYVMGGALVEPRQTLGDPDVPIATRIGGLDREHREDLAVLELVDAEAGLRVWLS
jgi:hypothetical protein